jgi:Protein of unknown function (DUF3592)
MMAITYIGLGVAFVGGFLMWSDRRVIWDGWRSRRWVGIPAIIIGNRDSSFVIDGANQITGGAPVKYYESQRLYEYEWEGQKYRGSTFRFGGHADQPLDFIPVGHEFKVFCNPQAPAESVINPGLGQFIYVELAIFVAGLIVSFL